MGRSGLVALVDDVDFDLVGQHAWQARRHSHSKVTYAVRRFGPNRTKSQYMHSLLTGWRQVDHIDHNGLNNRRENLRETNHSKNQVNTFKREGCSSQFKGVSWNKQRGLWEARITLNRLTRRLGLFGDEEEAAAAYDRAAIETFGDIARLNLAG